MSRKTMMTVLVVLAGFGLTGLSYFKINSQGYLMCDMSPIVRGVGQYGVTIEQTSRGFPLTYMTAQEEGEDCLSSAHEQLTSGKTSFDIKNLLLNTIFWSVLSATVLVGYERIRGKK